MATDRPTLSVRRRRARRDDEGAVLLVTIVMFVVGSLIVGGLASYAVASLRALPTARSRTTRVEAVKSGLRLAMTMQRDAGPTACFDDVVSWTINDLPVTVQCSSTQSYATGSDRYGVITTTNTNNEASLRGASSSTFNKPVDGKVLLNAGLLSGPTANLAPNSTTVEMSRYQSANTPLARYRVNPTATPAGCDDPTIGSSKQFVVTPGYTLTCTNEPWWNLAGDASAGVRQYPLLPQIPTYARDNYKATIAGCKVWYPGRYTGGGTITLTGTNYFASGLYYFEQPVSISAGATVVMGEGKYRGCVFDTDAAFAPTAPKSHEITGKGVTVLLGKAANITVAGGAKLTINRRVSSASSRGSEGQAIRTVSFGVNTTAIQIPADQVKLSDGSLQAVAAHEVLIGTGGQKAKYSASTLATNANALSVTLAANSDVLIDGYVFTPQAKVTVTGAAGVTNYGVRMYGGLAATNVVLDVASAPTDAAKWFVGMRTEVIQRKFSFVATALVDGHTVESRSSFELHQDKSYAINYWTVDA